MPICLSCAIRRRKNCDNCVSLSPIPDHVRVAKSVHSMMKELNKKDQKVLDHENKMKEYYVQQEKKAAAIVQRKNKWKRHERASKLGPCSIVNCVCREVVK